MSPSTGYLRFYRPVVMIFQNLFHQSERSEKPSEEMEVGEKRPAAFHDRHGSSLSGQILGHHVYLTKF